MRASIWPIVDATTPHPAPQWLPRIPFLAALYKVATGIAEDAAFAIPFLENV